MESSREKREQRSVFDINTPQKKRLLSGRNVLNLRPKFKGRHPLVWTLVLLIAILGIFLISKKTATKAEVQDFYPTACLGNWQNPANAQGKPETMDPSTSAFTDANSAVYTSSSQIFCGSFIPPASATSGQITNVGLTLVWQVGDVVPPTPTVSVPVPTVIAPTSTDETTSTSTQDIASTTDQTPPTSAGASLAPIDADTNTTVAPTSSGSSFLRALIPFALADDADSSSPSSTETPTIVAIAPPAPDENFLDVSYSTDGQTWVSIGKANVSNWKQFTVTLPISNWGDLQNLQIRVEGIQTTQDPVPPVYLDGMFMEVHYELTTGGDLNIVPSSTEVTVSSTRITSSTAPTRMTLVNPGAAQTCDVQPFSQVLPLGGTASFIVNLHPSINGVSYELQVGHLPTGVSADIGSPSGDIAATSSLTFEAEASTIPGSLNIAVIYHEHESDGSVLANFCQLNIDVR